MDKASTKIVVDTLFWASLLLRDKYDKFWQLFKKKTEYKILHKPSDSFYCLLQFCPK